MISFLKKLHLYSPAERIINCDYFLDAETRSFYEQNGYAVIPDKVPEQAIGIINETFQMLYNQPGFFETEGFITSPNYTKEIQQLVHLKLSEATDLIVPAIFDVTKISYNILNILVLKFKQHNDTILFPHQDVSMADEYIAPTTFMWIPTCDIDEKNGSLLVLPKSHKWCAWQRTHNQQESPLKNNRDLVLEKMIPLYLKKGDLVLFDSALVHASSANISNQVRVAMNSGVIPENNRLIHYKKSTKTPKGKIEKYTIDKDFWKEGFYTNPDFIPEKYRHSLILEEEVCNFQINRLNLKYLLQKYASN